VVIASMMKSTGTTLNGAPERPKRGIGCFMRVAREITRSA